MEHLNGSYGGACAQKIKANAALRAAIEAVDRDTAKHAERERQENQGYCYPDPFSNYSVTNHVVM